jgi:hypothetical protein
MVEGISGKGEDRNKGFKRRRKRTSSGSISFFLPGQFVIVIQIIRNLSAKRGRENS